MKKIVLQILFIIICVSSPAQTNLIGYEFWFNNEYSNKQSIDIVPATQHQIIQSIDVSVLPFGVNVFNLRYRDENGLYSSTLSRVFYKVEDTELTEKMLTEYEYWFNNDYSNKQTVEIIPDEEYQLISGIDASLMPEGVNILNLRFKDETGAYSSILSKVFYRNENSIDVNRIFAYRYWFDNDLENSQYINLQPPVQQLNITGDLDMTGITKGKHAIHFQVRDSIGLWSVVTTDTIEKVSLPVADFGYEKIYEDCDSTIISFSDSSIDGDKCLWNFGDGLTDSVRNPVHKYFGGGNYQVSLTTTDTITKVADTKQVPISVSGKTYESVSETVCESYTSPSGHYFYTESGIYNDTILNDYDCYCVITIDLTILVPATGTDVISSCGPYKWIDGETYASDNNTATYIIKGGTVNGCDSIVTLDLTVNYVNTSVLQDNETLTANTEGAEYQWLDCDNGMTPLAGETSQSFTATVNGNYAVKITENSCTDTSSCYSVYILSALENNFDSEIIIYPNPTNGNVTVDLGRTYSEINVMVNDLSGSLIRVIKTKNKQLFDLMIDEPRGTYLITIISNKQKAVFKVIKN